jgi:hypothetical protein
MALLDLLDCSMADLIEPVGAAAARGPKRAAAGNASVGSLRPKPARIVPSDGR